MNVHAAFLVRMHNFLHPLVFIFYFVIGSFFSQIWLHPRLQATRLVRKTALISWGKIEKVRREAQQLNSGSWKNNLKVVSAQSITYRQVITIHFCRSQPSNSLFHPQGKPGGGRTKCKQEYHALQREAAYLKLSRDPNHGAGRRGFQASPPIPIIFLNSLLRRWMRKKNPQKRAHMVLPRWNDNTSDREWKYSIVYPTRLFFWVCWKLGQW